MDFEVHLSQLPEIDKQLLAEAKNRDNRLGEKLIVIYITFGYTPTEVFLTLLHRLSEQRYDAISRLTRKYHSHMWDIGEDTTS